MNSQTLPSVLQQKILILDGAMGTMIQKHNLLENDFRGARYNDHPISLAGCYDVLVLTKPQMIKDIHIKYLEVGADIITTCTFNSTAVSLSDFGLEAFVKEINNAAARLAKEAAGECMHINPYKPRYVAGSLGPTSKRYLTDPTKSKDETWVEFDKMVAAYYEQISGLIEGGVDLILIETIIDIHTANAALFAINEYSNRNNFAIPVMLSATLTDHNFKDVFEFFDSLSNNNNILSVGFNCVDVIQIKPYLEKLSKNTPHYISFSPNAGLPDKNNKYQNSPDKMASSINEYLGHGLLNIIGGCCGTTPLHIKKFAGIAESSVPRKVD